jgi:hypothetical protein
MRCPQCRSIVIQGEWAGICERCYVTDPTTGTTSPTFWRAMLIRRYVRVIEKQIGNDVFLGDTYLSVSDMVLRQLERNRGFFRRRSDQYVPAWPEERKGPDVSPSE